MDSHSALLEEVDDEMERQHRKWGHQPHELLYWLAIAGEEFGEVAKALVDDMPLSEVRGELVQLAAVIVHWIEDIDLNHTS